MSSKVAFHDLVPSTGVVGCAFARFGIPSRLPSLCVASRHRIDVYASTTEDEEPDWQVVGGSSVPGRICGLQKVTLYGPPAQVLARVQAVDVLLVALEEAKLSVVGFDPASLQLRTLSVMNFEPRATGFGALPLISSRTERPAGCSDGLVALAVEPRMRCAAAAILDTHIAVIRFRSDAVEMEEDDSMDLALLAAVAGSRGAHAARTLTAPAAAAAGTTNTNGIAGHAIADGDGGGGDDNDDEELVEAAATSGRTAAADHHGEQEEEPPPPLEGAEGNGEEAAEVAWGFLPAAAGGLDTLSRVLHRPVAVAPLARLAPGLSLPDGSIRSMAFLPSFLEPTLAILHTTVAPRSHELWGVEVEHPCRCGLSVISVNPGVEPGVLDSQVLWTAWGLPSDSHLVLADPAAPEGAAVVVAGDAVLRLTSNSRQVLGTNCFAHRTAQPASVPPVLPGMGPSAQKQSARGIYSASAEELGLDLAGAAAHWISPHHLLLHLPDGDSATLTLTRRPGVAVGGVECSLERTPLTGPPVSCAAADPASGLLFRGSALGNAFLLEMKASVTTSDEQPVDGAPATGGAEAIDDVEAAERLLPLDAATVQNSLGEAIPADWTDEAERQLYGATGTAVEEKKEGEQQEGEEAAGALSGTSCLPPGVDSLAELRAALPAGDALRGTGATKVVFSFNSGGLTLPVLGPAHSISLLSGLQRAGASAPESRAVAVGSGYGPSGSMHVIQQGEGVGALQCQIPIVACSALFAISARAGLRHMLLTGAPPKAGTPPAAANDAKAATGGGNGDCGDDGDDDEDDPEEEDEVVIASTGGQSVLLDVRRNMKPRALKKQPFWLGLETVAAGSILNGTGVLQVVESCVRVVLMTDAERHLVDLKWGAAAKGGLKPTASVDLPFIPVSATDAVKKQPLLQADVSSAGAALLLGRNGQLRVCLVAPRGGDLAGPSRGGEWEAGTPLPSEPLATEVAARYSVGDWDVAMVDPLPGHAVEAASLFWDANGAIADWLGRGGEGGDLPAGLLVCVLAMRNGALWLVSAASGAVLFRSPPGLLAAGSHVILPALALARTGTAPPGAPAATADGAAELEACMGLAPTSAAALATAAHKSVRHKLPRVEHLRLAAVGASGQLTLCVASALGDLAVYRLAPDGCPVDRGAGRMDRSGRWSGAPSGLGELELLGIAEQSRATGAGGLLARGKSDRKAAAPSDAMEDEEDADAVEASAASSTSTPATTSARLGRLQAGASTEAVRRAVRPPLLPAAAAMPRLVRLAVPIPLHVPVAAAVASQKLGRTTAARRPRLVVVDDGEGDEEASSCVLCMTTAPVLVGRTSTGISAVPLVVPGLQPSKKALGRASEAATQNSGLDRLQRAALAVTDPALLSNKAFGAAQVLAFPVSAACSVLAPPAPSAAGGVPLLCMALPHSRQFAAGSLASLSSRFAPGASAVGGCGAGVRVKSFPLGGTGRVVTALPTLTRATRALGFTSSGPFVAVAVEEVTRQPGVEAVQVEAARMATLPSEYKQLDVGPHVEAIHLAADDPGMPNLEGALARGAPRQPPPRGAAPSLPVTQTVIRVLDTSRVASSGAHAVVAEVKLRANEHVMSMAELSLPLQSMNGPVVSHLAVCVSFLPPKNEDERGAGRLLLLRLAPTLAPGTQPPAPEALTLQPAEVHVGGAEQERRRPPFMAMSVVHADHRHFVMVGSGPKVLVYQWRHGSLDPVCSVDCGVAITSLVSIKNYVIAGDSVGVGGCRFLEFFDSEPAFAEQRAGRGTALQRTAALSLCIAGSSLSVVVYGEDGVARLLQYAPGRRDNMRRVADVDTGSIPLAATPLPLLPISDQGVLMARRPGQVRGGSLVSTAEGGVGALIPMPASAHARLRELQRALATSVALPCGLSPGAFRQSRHEPPGADAVGGVLDASLLLSYCSLPVPAQRAIALAAGTYPTNALSSLRTLQAALMTLA